MKLKMVLIVCISLIAIMSIGAISASEDIANDTVTAIEPTDEVISQAVDEIEPTDEAIGQAVDEIEPTDEVISQPAEEEIYAADESEDILTVDEEFYPMAIEPWEFFTKDQMVASSYMFSVGEKFKVGIDTNAKVNGTFKVYYAGLNDYDYYKWNDTVLAESEIIDGIGITEVSVPKTRILGYLTDYIYFWIEYKTPKGNGGFGFEGPQIIENYKNMSATVKPLEFVEEGNNNITVKVYVPVDGTGVIYLDGQGAVIDFNGIRSYEKTYEYLTVGTHTVRVFFEHDYYDDNDPYKYSQSFTVTVKEYVPVIVQAATKITSSAISLTFNTAAKTVTFTLKDEDGNALPKKPVIVKFNGKTYNKVTNSLGKVTLKVSSLIVPKTYTATMKFEGDESYKASSKSVNVVVNKATPKITAKAKTFKKSVATKKYSIILKTNQNKVLKKKKVSIKVNKKTYYATTNNKGVATFKITKLAKKGKYTATVKFAGNNSYKAKSVKVSITVK